MITQFGLFLIVLGYLFLNWIRRQIRVKDITNKYVLITGCDSGFGQMLAQRLDMLGMNVIAGCLTEAAQPRLKSVTSSRLRTIKLDVTSCEDISQAVDFVSAVIPAEKGLWALVNNAGVMGPIGPMEWQTVDNFLEVFEVNTMGCVRMTMAFLPLLKKGKGRIINMSSINGRVSNAMNIPYCISECGIEVLSDALRPYLLQWDVSVHVLEPQGFQTNATSKDAVSKGMMKLWNNLNRQTKEEFGKEYFDGLKSAMLELVSEKSSPDIKYVMSAYVHALTARHPLIRYSVGWQAKYLYIPLSYMPSAVYDYVMGKLLTKHIPACIKNKDN